MRPTDDLRFSVLGPVRAWAGDAELALGPPQQRLVLAVLLIRNGSQVSVEELVDALWGEDPPASASGTVRIHVHRIRKVLEGTGGGPAVHSVSSGYLMRVGTEALDLARFRRGVDEAEHARRAGETDRTVVLLREALGLWRGKALAGLPGPWAEAQRTHLARLRLSALEACLGAQLDLGPSQDVAAELASLVAEHPLDERFREMLMLALYRSGRQAAALEVYRETQTMLADELGVDPGPALRGLHERILRSDPALLTGGAPPRDETAPGAATGAGRPEAAARIHRPDDAPAAAVPSQLPHDLPTFAGRVRELAHLEAVVAAADGEGTASGTVLAVTGMAGVGKTAFAVHFARRMAPRYPDGQLYLNLRGFGVPKTSLAPERALYLLLESLGVTAAKLPQDVDALAAAFRTIVAERRLLILLDNARDADQIRPLLAGAPGCLVVVTSRDQLSGLVVKDGAHHLTLNVLSADESREALERRIGAGRVRAEPEAVDEIVARGARLPLALALVAGRAATRSGFSLATVAAELREEAASLDAFGDADDTLDVRSVFSWSYHALSPEAARLFRLLALHPGPDASPAGVASLAGRTPGRTRRLVGELVSASLLGEHRPGRFRMHDLLRQYAAELLDAEDDDADRTAATNRLIGYYLLTAYEAARMTSQTLPELVLPAAATGVVPETISGYPRAMEWFRREHAALLGVVAQAAVLPGFETHTWQLAWSLMEYLQRCGRWEDQITVQRTALAAARRGDDRLGRAHALRNLARAFIETSRLDKAEEHLNRSLGLAEELGDVGLRARIHGNLAMIRLRRGLPDEALPHVRAAVDLFREDGDRAGQANALNNLGWIHAELGDYQRALAYCRQALTLLRHLGDRKAEAAAWDSLGYVHHRLGDYRQAKESYHRALDLDRELADTWNEADTLVRLGDAHLASGDQRDARLAWHAALIILETLGSDAAATPRARLRDLGEGVGR
ncbi:DNA-binding transcriptional activator of the SARP family [Actinacidiphila alni]|uniref:DNA-binding transcriptional activator of the SARP family n=1 Tax=Actinacidiphila alni TaxID=380248 RepID=A0A1I2J261_9ACTN|nr:BTAD domain-containing putative transcriptional regulator [Actinacidiphila alni]SFF47337.1 DNA-binding transcriptional activator of the SARP family [Actinacidiphila alni]